MKKTILMLAACALASSALAQVTNQVLSKNAVGYVKVDLAADELAFIRTDFEPLSGEGTVVDFIGDQLPLSSSAYVWDVSNQAWVVYNKSGKGWGSLTNVVFDRGSALFVRSPQTTNLFIMGEVPDEATGDVFVYPGLSALGFAYPVAVVWSNTALSQTLDLNDQFIVWDGSAYTIYNKTGKGWGTGSSLVLEPGQGFFVRKFSNTTNTWSETKPYTWP